MTAAEILGAITAHAASAKDRGDEAFGHVSDLAFCNRKTWARRNAKPLMPKDAQTRMKFALGNAVEAYVCEAIATTELMARRDVRVAIAVRDGTIVSREIAPDEEPLSDEIVGHLDLDLPGAVVEVKSTTFLRDRKNGFKPIVPRAETVQEHYKIQGAAYALARGKYLIIVIVDRDTGITVAYGYDPHVWEGRIKARIADVLALTKAGAPMPPAEPIQTWDCKYCDYTECERWMKK